MTREEKIFEMAKALAPSIANAGIALQNNLVQRGHKPQDCTVGDKDIPHAYGESLMVWATAFVDELDVVCKTSPQEKAPESIQETSAMPQLWQVDFTLQFMRKL